MNKLLKLTSVLTISVLLQACAPQNSGSGASETWWRVTPVDISEGGAEVLTANTNIMDPTVAAPVAPVAAPVTPAPQQDLTPAADLTTVSVFRLRSGFSYLIRQSSTEANQPYWVSEGEKYAAFKTASADRKAIYACVAANDYFTSNFANCEGFQVIGRIGFVEKAASEIAPRALFRCVGGRGAGHLDTTVASDCTNAGFRVEGTLGYVP